MSNGSKEHIELSYVLNCHRRKSMKIDGASKENVKYMIDMGRISSNFKQEAKRWCVNNNV